jgi:ABC-type uncharacterized transport system ATPase subunit
MAQIRVEALTKIYPTVVANRDVSLAVEPGEIHAVLGENGAGKSTLMKMIYGLVRPTSGQIFWEEQPVEILSPADAHALGIGMVFQHFSLFESLTVAENIFLSLHQGRSQEQVSEDIRQCSMTYGLPLDPNRVVHDLSVGERQRVEIVRCLMQRPRLLIMDEPTSVLSPQATQSLFKTLRQIRDQGCSIIYISHKLEEIRTLCDRVTVLRDGQVAGSDVVSGLTAEDLAKMMVGRPIAAPLRSPVSPGPVLLKTERLSVGSDDPFGVSLTNVSLSLVSGEIFGIAGVSGSGQRELVRALTGETLTRSPEMISLGDLPAGELTVAERRAYGLLSIPEDRVGSAVLPGLSLTENLLLTGIDRLNLVQRGFLMFSRAAEMAQRCIERYQVKAQSSETPVAQLSGGNIQKFVVGRELMQSPKVLICEQPTWGVDMAAAAFIRQELISLARSGCAVLVISEELEELFEICDRMAVMAQGRLSPARRISETTVEEIGLWMGGNWPGEEDARNVAA